MKRPRRFTIDRVTRDAIDSIQFEKKRDTIAALLEDGKVRQTSRGTFLANPELPPAELEGVREDALDMKLPTDPQKRREMLEQATAIADQVQATLETVGSEGRLASILSEIAELQKDTKSALQSRDHRSLGYINDRMVASTKKLLSELNVLRQKNPDKMIAIVRKLQEMKGPVNHFKRALIEFVSTHNSFRFSKTQEKELYERYCNAISRNRGNKPTGFDFALWEAYDTPKKMDDPDTFYARMTNIPPKRLQPLLNNTSRVRA